MPYKDIVKRRAAHKRYYEKNLAKYYLKNKKRKKMLLIFVNDLKHKPCSDCGILYPPYVMGFDHRGEEEKIDSIARLIREGRSKKSILNEIAKCDLVCANCHRERTHKRYIAGSSNGRIEDSESFHLRPNRSPAAHTDYNPKAAIHQS